MNNIHKEMVSNIYSCINISFHDCDDDNDIYQWLR